MIFIKCKLSVDYIFQILYSFVVNRWFTRKGEKMNRDLIGVMAKFEITQRMMADVINVSMPTFKVKLDERRFTQSEIDKMVNYLNTYDKSIDSNLFFRD